LSGGIEITTVHKCCEEKKSMMDGLKLSGSLKAGIGENCHAGIGIPGVGQVGGFVNLGGECNVSPGVDLDACEGSCWSITGSCKGTLKGGLYGYAISKKVLYAHVDLGADGSISVSRDCHKTEWKGCVGPAKVTGAMLLANFQNKAISYTFPNSKKCRP
jgi:hypothetical protein